ncbi:hypothetical protein VBK15_12480, partial [Enterobacter hormaechei]|nr:hypothetical protein [Enterobacter hormaechei]
MSTPCDVKLRPLEREDLRFVHQLDNNASVMRYWFEEPYEAFVELSDLYDKHIHDQSERRFVVECEGEKAGLVELVEINHVHRRAEFQIPRFYVSTSKSIIKALINMHSFEIQLS